MKYYDSPEAKVVALNIEEDINDWGLESGYQGDE